MVSVGCPESTACPGSVVCWAPTASKTAPGTEVVALTTPDEAGVTGGGMTVVEPRVIFTTRRTTTIDRIRTTKTHVTSAMGTRRRGGPGGVSSWVPLSCVVAMVEEPRCSVECRRRHRARTEERPAYLRAVSLPRRGGGGRPQ